MEFNDHRNIRGEHSFLSASKYHWTNYSTEKLRDTYTRFLAIERGTRLHNLACELIELKIKQQPLEDAFNMFVNDAIGYRMYPERPLFYSINAFGTPDAISFRDNLLRIHDLKTGVTKPSMRQLEVYAAYFCLEYDVSPHSINIELRIYQGDVIIQHHPDPDEIQEIMDKTVIFDKEIEKIKQELE